VELAIVDWIKISEPTYSYINADLSWQPISHQPVREAVSYRGLFTTGWFGVREKHYFRLEIYDRLRVSEQAACHSATIISNQPHLSAFGGV